MLFTYCFLDLLGTVLYELGWSGLGRPRNMVIVETIDGTEAVKSHLVVIVVI